MLKKIVIFIVILLDFLYQFAFAQLVPISNLHQNNSSGEPQLLNQKVTVTGEVTVTTQFGIQAAIQDTTGGVVVYDENFATKVKIGDELTISGTVTQYNGLTELINVTIIQRNLKAPSLSPQIITCRDIATEGKDGIENLEGELVRINDVTVNTSNWTVAGSGSNYVLTDSTGACEIRIDKDTNIANTSAPGGKFDVIAIVSQYDPTSPYTQGYQLMPRFIEDIIWVPVTQIINGPKEKNITPYSMDIVWSTNTQSNSLVIYGTTSNYEIDTLFVDESVVDHQVTLTGLSPATIYHLKVGAWYGDKKSFSNDYVVITASDPTSTGEMRVYFNQSVDHSYSQSKQASGNINLLSKFIQRINSAKYSIDACFYYIIREEAAQVLVGAYKKGIKVRVIYDYDPNDPFDSDAIKLIKNANVPIINDTFGNNSGYAAMHNKFLIVDHRDHTSAADDWVWTGSYNLTRSATYDNAENVIEIQDQALAECYTVEFNEMWGSDTNTPDPTKSRFGSRKTNNTPHGFNINGIEVLQYMSASDRGLDYIVAAIQNSQSALYFCMLLFTQSKIANAMKFQWNSINNFKVKGVFDSDLDNNSQYYNLKGTGSQPWNRPADVHLDHETGYLHHKYLIIDGAGGPGQPIIITGSYNWTSAAESSNDENFLMIKDSILANLYLQEFAARYHNAGGKEELVPTGVESHWKNNLLQSVQLSQNYPNPFNRQTTINIALAARSEIQLDIFNINGQLVRCYELGVKPPGEYRIVWDGGNDSGELVAGGIYFYRLSDDIGVKNSQFKKMVYLP